MPSITKVKAALHAFIQAGGGGYRDWCVGVTDDPARTLFAEHGVDADTDLYLTVSALLDKSARVTARYFESLGCEGVEGPVASDARTVQSRGGDGSDDGCSFRCAKPQHRRSRPPTVRPG